jgi:hypothetical protein
MFRFKATQMPVYYLRTLLKGRPKKEKQDCVTELDVKEGRKKFQFNKSKMFKIASMIWGLFFARLSNIVFLIVMTLI